MTQIIKKLSNRHVVYAIVLGLLVIGTYLPGITLPIPVQPWVQQFYDVIQSLTPNDNILYGGGPDGAVYWDVEPSAIIVCKHIVRTGCHVIYWSATVESQISWNDMLVTVYGADYKNHPDYGKKFVVIGYVPGSTAAQQAFLKDFKGYLKVDMFGNSLTDYNKLPMMANIKDGYSFKVDAGARGGVGYALYKVPYGGKTIWIGAAQDRTQNVANWQIGQRDGLIGSTQDGAQYELLMNLPGLCMKFQISYVLGIAFVLMAIVVSNINKIIIPRFLKAKEEA